MPRNHFPPGYKPAVGDTLVLVREATRWSPLDTLPSRVSAVRRKYFDTETTYTYTSGGSFTRTDTWRLDTFGDAGGRGNDYELFPDEAAYRKHAEDTKAVSKAQRLMQDFGGGWGGKRITVEQARAVIAILEPTPTPETTKP